MGRKKHHDHEEHMDEGWLVPYADLLTLLLALFIVLFAVSQTDYKKKEDMAAAIKVIFSGGQGVMSNPSAVSPSKTDPKAKKPKTQMSSQEKKEAGQAEKKNLEEIKKQVEQVFKDKGIENKTQVSIDNERLRIIITDDAVFAPGKATLRPEALSMALNLSDALAKANDHKITVTGHTDTIPISTEEFPTNWDLSSQRAVNFMKVLLNNPQLDPHLFEASGKGEFQPLLSNDSEIGRKRNRRVEVWIEREFEEVETKPFWDADAAKEKINAESMAKLQSEAVAKETGSAPSRDRREMDMRSPEPESGPQRGNPYLKNGGQGE